MLINKFDFESGLQQDKQQLGPGAALPNQGPSNKPNLFSANPNISSGGHLG